MSRVARQLTFYDFEGFRELCHFFDEVHEELADMHEALKKPRAYIKVELTGYTGDTRDVLEIDLEEADKG